MEADGDVNLMNEHKLTPLHMAFMGGHHDCVKLLMQVSPLTLSRALSPSLPTSLPPYLPLSLSFSLSLSRALSLSLARARAHSLSY